MKTKLNFGALFLSIIVGIVIVLFFTFISGKLYSTALFPTLALLSGFIVTGFTIGIMTKEITITEPGIGAIIVAIVTYLVIPLYHLRGFEGIWGSDWLLIFMNAIVLTFVGSWLGEKFQHGIVDSQSSTSPNLDWSWVVAGTIAGLTVSLIIVNILDLIFGHHPDRFIIPFFISILFTGLVVGWKSPGVTIREAGIAGFLTITLDLNIVRLTLKTETEIGLLYIIIGVVIGFLVSLLGGYIGEKFQANSEVKAFK